jgi:hypothetical protein
MVLLELMYERRLVVLPEGNNVFKQAVSWCRLL